MEEIKRELSEAYKILSSMYINGNAVDVVAVVKAKLRKVIEELDKERVE